MIRHAQLQVSSIASPSPITSVGSLPSANIFSNFCTSAKVFAFRTRASNRFFSVSVIFIPLPLATPLTSPAGAAAEKDLLERMAMMDCASSVGCSNVPKSSWALLRSASLTFWKSRKRIRGLRHST